MGRVVDVGSHSAYGAVAIQNARAMSSGKQASATTTPLCENRSTRSADVLLIALPFLPLLSASSPFRNFGLSALIVVTALLVHAGPNLWRSDMHLAAISIALIVPFGLTLGSATHEQALIQITQLGLIAAALFVAPQQSTSRLAALITVGICLGLSCFVLADLALLFVDTFNNPNMFGSAGAFWTLLVLKIAMAQRRDISRFFAITLCLVPLTLVMTSQSRASLAFVIVAVAWFVLSNQMSKYRQRTVLATVALIMPMAIAYAAYKPSLAHTNMEPPPIREQQNRAQQSELSNPTSRNLLGLSSRDVIWSTIIYEVENNGFAGRGLGRLPSEVLWGRLSGLSAHNGFVQLFFQLGPVGVLLFTTACWLVISAAAKRPRDDAGLAIFSGALVHEAFEVALTQNNFGFGIGIWLLVALPMPGVQLDKQPNADVPA
jgi:hypothetical protein